MKLTIKDRFIVSQLLPQQGSILTQLVCKDIIQKIELTKEEVEKWEVNTADNKTTWNPEKAEVIDVKFTGGEISELKRAVDRLDAENKVTTEMVDLLVKIKDLK